VVMQQIDGVRRPTVVAHRAERIASLLKASSEGEGLSTCPERDS
jgi:hypothetical protein